MKSIIFSISLFFCVQSFGQIDLPKPLRHFMQAGASPAGEIQYGNNPQAGHYVQAGDAKIYYEVYGKGQPLVILHGGVYGSIYEMSNLLIAFQAHTR